MRRVAAFLALGALAGCSMDPHYSRPAPAAPPSWPQGDAYPQVSGAALPSISYRDIFRDPRLQAIIEQALANNQDLRQALANIAAARGLYRVQRADIFPAVDASAGVTERRGSSSGTSSNHDVVTTYDVQGGTTAWEVDLFGRLQSLSRAAFNQYLATTAAERATKLTLVADIANAWLTLAADRSLLLIAEDTGQKRCLRLAQTKGARRPASVSPRRASTAASRRGPISVRRKRYWQRRKRIGRASARSWRRTSTPSNCWPARPWRINSCRAAWRMPTASWPSFRQASIRPYCCAGPM